MGACVSCIYDDEVVRQALLVYSAGFHCIRCGDKDLVSRINWALGPGTENEARWSEIMLQLNQIQAANPAKYVLREFCVHQNVSMGLSAVFNHGNPPRMLIQHLETVLADLDRPNYGNYTIQRLLDSRFSCLNRYQLSGGREAADAPSRAFFKGWLSLLERTLPCCSSSRLNQFFGSSASEVTSDTFAKMRRAFECMCIAADVYRRSNSPEDARRNIVIAMDLLSRS